MQQVLWSANEDVRNEVTRCVCMSPFAAGMEFPSYLPEFAERDVPRGITQKRRDVDGRNNVRVRANVIEIVEVDTVRETFQAVFVLEFTYVDPTLENTWLHLKYRDDNGSVVTTFAQVPGGSS